MSAPVSPQYGRATSPFSTSPAGGASPVHANNEVVRSQSSHSLLGRYHDDRLTASLDQLRVPKKKGGSDGGSDLRPSRSAEYSGKGKAAASPGRASSFSRGNSIDAHPVQLPPAMQQAKHPHPEARIPHVTGVPRHSLPSAGPASASSSRPQRATPTVTERHHSAGSARPSDATQSASATRGRHGDGFRGTAPVSSSTGGVPRQRSADEKDAHAAKRMRFTIVELLRPIVNPLYASGVLSRDQFKSTLKAVCTSIVDLRVSLVYFLYSSHNEVFTACGLLL